MKTNGATLKVLLTSVCVAYLLLGIVQSLAIYAGLTQWVGWHASIAAPASIFLGCVPLVGTAIGMYGAVYSWQWGWGSSFALFCGPMIVIALFALQVFVISKRKSLVRP